MTEYDTAKPYLAVHLIFRKDNKVAFVLRKHTGWMDGQYGLPGGKVEKDESAIQAAIREAKEEVGVDIQPENLHYVMTRYRHSEDSDWIDLFFEASEWEGELTNNEPHVHGELAWFDPENLPENTLRVGPTVFDYIKAGKTYGEYGWE